jgi:hypothetical protein
LLLLLLLLLWFVVVDIFSSLLLLLLLLLLLWLSGRLWLLSSPSCSAGWHEADVRIISKVFGFQAGNDLN